MLGLGVVVAAFLSAPTFAVWCLAFLNAKPAWRKDDDAAEGGMENDVNVGVGLARSGFERFCLATILEIALRARVSSCGDPVPRGSSRTHYV